MYNKENSYGQGRLCDRIDKSVKRNIIAVISTLLLLFPVLSVVFFLAESFFNKYIYGIYIALGVAWLVELGLAYLLIRKLRYGAKTIYKTMENLRQRVAFSEALFYDAPMGIVLFDSNGKITEANSYFAALSGYNTEEIKTKSVTDFFEQADEILRVTSEFYAYEGKETFLLTKNDGQKTVLAKISNPSAENNQLHQMILLDISKEYQVKKQIEELFKIIRIAGRIARFGGYKYEISSNKMIITPEIAKFLGFPPKDSLGIENFLNIVSEKDRNSLEVRFNSLKEDKDSFVVDFELKKRDKQKRIFLRHICELEVTEDGKRTIWGALYDISELERQKELLRENERKYFSMINIAPVGIALLDVGEAYKKLRSHFQNAPTAAELNNLTNDEIKAILSSVKIIEYNNSIYSFITQDKKIIDMKNLVNIIYEEDLLKTVSAFNKIFTSETFIQETIRLINRKTNKIYYSLLRVQKFESENKTYAVFTASDLTEYLTVQTKLETSNELLYNFLNTIPFIVVSLNVEGKVTFINNAGAKLIGKPKDEILGTAWYDKFLLREDKERLLPIFKKAMDGKKTRFPNRTNPIKTQNGLRTIYWYNEIIFDDKNKPSGTLSLGIDITDERRHKKELNKSYKELVLLKHHLEKQNKELNRVKRVLEEREKLLQKEVEEKDKLFSIIAHDIRSPFTGLLANLQLLVESYDDILEEEKYLFTKNAFLSSQKIFNFIDMLLRWAKVRLDKVSNKPHPTLILPIVNEIIELYSTQLKSKEIEIINKIDENTCLFVDEYLFSGVIRNLLANSIKFTPRSGTITLEAEEKERIYEIRISDTGVGIPEEKLSKVFNFSSMGTSLGTEGEKGSGLGLMLVKEFVTKLGGRIYVDSQLNKGTTFIIYLPKSKDCEEPQQQN